MILSGNMETKRPNVLIFVTDQHRNDHLGCNGNPILRTPNIDRLAQSGVVFERAYVANPLCMPARASMFTGRTPRGHGVRTNGIPLSSQIPTFPEALRLAGYRTHSIGKLHMGVYEIPKKAGSVAGKPEEHPESYHTWSNRCLTQLPMPYFGFETAELTSGHTDHVFGHYAQWMEDEYPGMLERMHVSSASAVHAPDTWTMDIPEQCHHSHWIADRAIEFLQSEAQTQERPFFLWCSFPDPHHSYACPAPWADMYQAADMPLPNRRKGELEELPPFYREIYEQGKWCSGLTQSGEYWEPWISHIQAMTYGMISQVDHNVGRVMSELERLGLRENTIVAFISDHGDMMGDHWMNMKGPFHFEGLLNIPWIWSWPGQFPQGMRTQGLVSQIDLAPTILDLCGVSMQEQQQTMQGSMSLPQLPGRSFRAQLMGEADRVQGAVIVENDEDWLGLRLRTIITDRYKLNHYAGKPYGELFDLREDPREQHNLWDDPEFKKLKLELTEHLLDLYIQQESVHPRRLTHA